MFSPVLVVFRTKTFHPTDKKESRGSPRPDFPATGGLVFAIKPRKKSLYSRSKSTKPSRALSRRSNFRKSSRSPLIKLEARSAFGRIATPATSRLRKLKGEKQ